MKMQKESYFDWDAIRLAIREARERHCLSQKQISIISGVSRVSITNFEQGHHTLSSEALIRVCDFFELNPKKFLDWSKFIND